MAKPFDTAAKHALDLSAGSWLAYLRVVPDGPVRVMDADVSTVTAEVAPLLGEIRFGPADQEVRQAVEAIQGPERLLSVSNWGELLAEPAPVE